MTGIAPRETMRPRSDIAFEAHVSSLFRYYETRARTLAVVRDAVLRRWARNPYPSAGSAWNTDADRDVVESVATKTLPDGDLDYPANRR